MVAALASGDTRGAEPSRGGHNDPTRILFPMPEMRLRERAQLPLRAVRSLRPTRPNAPGGVPGGRRPHGSSSRLTERRTAPRRVAKARGRTPSQNGACASLPLAMSRRNAARLLLGRSTRARPRSRWKRSPGLSPHPSTPVRTGCCHRCCQTETAAPPREAERSRTCVDSGSK